MEISTVTFILAILGSGFLSTVITVAAGWVKDILKDKELERKRLSDIRENAYRETMKDIDFIYSGINLSEEDIIKKKNNFLLNYRIMFLYSSDEVIKEINNILDILTSPVVDNEEMKKKKNKIAYSMIILRKQIVKDTKLTGDDFRHIT